MDGAERTRGRRGWVNRTARYGRGVGLVLAASVATVLLALALPVPSPRPARVTGPSAIPDGVAWRAPVPEDLRVFSKSQRWGDESLHAVHQRVATAEAAAAKGAATDEIGLVGLTMTKDRRASLVRFPDGAIARFLPGDRLPDGRILTLATETTLTLEGTEDGRSEVLDLFPPIPADRHPTGPDAETRGLPVASDATPAH